MRWRQKLHILVGKQCKRDNNLVPHEVLHGVKVLGKAQICAECCSEQECGMQVEIQDIVKIGYLNGLFVLARSIGLIGHALDQKRLQQPLYRHPWDAVLYTR